MNEKQIIKFKKLLNDNKDNIISDILLNIFNIFDPEIKDNTYEKLNDNFNKYIELKNSNIGQFKKYNYLVTSFCLLQNKNYIQIFIDFYLKLYNIDENNKLNNEDLFKKNIFLKIISFFLDFIILTKEDIKNFYKYISSMYHQSNIYNEDQIKSVINIIKIIYQTKNNNSEQLLNESYFLIKGDENLCIDFSLIREQSMRSSYNNEIIIFFDYFELINSNHLIILIDYGIEKITIIIENNVIKINNNIFQINQKYINSFGFYFESCEKKLIFFHNEKIFDEDIKIEINSKILENIVLFQDFFGKIYNFGGLINLNNDNKKNEFRDYLKNFMNKKDFNYKQIVDSSKNNFEKKEERLYFIYLSDFYIEKIFNKNKFLDYCGKSIINFDKEIYINNNKHLFNKIKYIGGFSVFIPLIRIILNDINNNEKKKIYLDDIINLMINNLVNNSNNKCFKKEKIYELLCYYCKNYNYFDKKILEINQNPKDGINNLYEYQMIINYNNELNNDYIFYKNQIFYILIEKCIIKLNNLIDYNENYFKDILDILERIDNFFNLQNENINKIKLDNAIYFKIIEKIINQILNIKNFICVYLLKYLLFIIFKTFKKINNNIYNQIILNYFDYFVNKDYKIIKYIHLVLQEEENQINEEIKNNFNDCSVFNNFVEFVENFGLLLFCYFLLEKDNKKKTNIIEKYKQILKDNIKNFVTNRAINIEKYFLENNSFDYKVYFYDNNENNNIIKLMYLFNMNFPLLIPRTLFSFYSIYIYKNLDNDNNNDSSYNNYIIKIQNYFFKNIYENINNKRQIFFYEEEYLIFLLMLFQNYIDLGCVKNNDIIHLRMKKNLKKYLNNYFKCHIFLYRQNKDKILKKYNFLNEEISYKKNKDLNQTFTFSQNEIEKLRNIYYIENCENIEQLIKEKIDNKINFYFKNSEKLLDFKLIFYFKKSYYISKNNNSKNNINFDDIFKKNEYNNFIYNNNNIEQYKYIDNLFKFNEFDKKNGLFLNNNYLKIKLLIEDKKIEKFNKKLLNSLFIFNGFWSTPEKFNYKLYKLKNFITNEYKLPLIKPIIDLDYYKLNFKYYNFDNFIRKNNSMINNNKIRKININKQSININNLLDKEEINIIINQFIKNMIEKGYIKFLIKIKFNIIDNIINEIKKKNLLTDWIKSIIITIMIDNFNIIQLYKNFKKEEFIKNVQQKLDLIIQIIIRNIETFIHNNKSSNNPKKEHDKNKSILKKEFYKKIIEKEIINFQNLEKLNDEIDIFLKSDFNKNIDKIINEMKIVINLNNLLLSDKYFNLKEVIFDQNILKYYFKEKYNNKLLSEFYDCCFIKKTHHIKGFIFIYINKNNLIQICFVSYLLNNIRKDCNNIYKNLKINCFGSLFNCPEKDELKIIKIQNYEIKLIFLRNYYFRNSGLEIYTINGKNYYFNFHNEETNKIFYKTIISKFSKLCPIKNDDKEIGYINEDVIKLNKINFDSLSSFVIVEESKVNNNNITILNLIKNWEKGLYSNYYILMICNIISNRSFSDLTQYPIFPLIYFYKNIDDLKNSIFDSQITFDGFQDINNKIDYYRKLELPIGQQDNIYDNKHDRRSLFVLGYNECEEFNENSFVKGNNVPKIYYYSLNYSNPVYVCYFLLRVIPFSFSAIEYQGNNFDTPNRLFISIYGTLINSNCQKSDIKEFIPEFYYFPEMFMNLSNINLGQFRDGKFVNDVELPKDLNSPERFVIDMYNKLEENNVAEKIGNWIDLIFGVNQKCDNEELKNAYKKGKFSKKMNLKNLFRTDSYLDDECDLINRNKLLAMNSVEFGLIPIQSFNKNFSGKNKIQKNKIEFYFIKINDFCKNLNIIDFNLCNFHNLENFEGKNIFYNSIVVDNKTAVFFNFIKNEQKFIGIYNNKELYLDCLEKRKCYTFINNKILLIGGIKNGILKCININNNNNQNEYLLKTTKNENKENLIITSLEFINFYENYYLLLGDNFGNVKLKKIKNNNLNNICLKKIKIIQNHSREVIYIVYNKNLNLWLSISLDGFINIYTFAKCVHVGNINIKDEYKDNLLEINYINFISKPISCIILCIKNMFISYSINGKKLESFNIENGFNYQIYEDKNFKENLYYLEKKDKETILNCRSLPYFEDNKELVKIESNIKFFYLDNFKNDIYLLYNE